MDPRNRIEIITLRGTLGLTIFWNWFIFQPAGKGPIFAKKKKKKTRGKSGGYNNSQTQFH